MGFVKTEPEKHKPLPGETRKESKQGRHLVNYRKKPAAPKVKQVDDFAHLKL